MDSVGKLAKALAIIAGQCGTIRATGENQHDRYKYASDADLKRHLQPLLANNGVSIVPTECATEWDEVRSSKGSAMARCRMAVTYLIAHESGETMTAQAFGEGIDRGDKAAYKAQTGAHKYLLRTVFAVPTTDDAEEASPVAHTPIAETVEPKRWTDKQRAAFCAELGALGYDYESVAAWCVSEGRPRPETMPPEQRAKVLAYLRGGDRSAKIAAAVVSQ